MQLSSQRRIAILGLSGAGKSTVAEMINNLVGKAAYTISFAEPLKTFAGNVFGFTNAQLWGPTESRNAPDPRFSGDARLSTVNQVRRRYDVYKKAWLVDVLPPGVDADMAERRLDQWFEETLMHDPLTPRYVLQTLGTEWGRYIHGRIWSLRGVRRANDILENGYLVEGFTAFAYACDVVIVSDLRFLNEAEDWTQAGGEIWLIDRPGLDESATGSAGVAKHASEEEQKSPEMRKFITHVIVNDGTLEELRMKIKQLLEGVLAHGGAGPR